MFGKNKCFSQTKRRKGTSKEWIFSLPRSVNCTPYICMVSLGAVNPEDGVYLQRNWGWLPNHRWRTIFVALLLWAAGHPTCALAHSQACDAFPGNSNILLHFYSLSTVCHRISWQKLLITNAVFLSTTVGVTSPELCPITALLPRIRQPSNVPFQLIMFTSSGHQTCAVWDIPGTVLITLFSPFIPKG